MLTFTAIANNNYNDYQSQFTVIIARFFIALIVVFILFQP